MSTRPPILAALAESALRGYARLAPTERGGYRLARLVRRFRPRDRWRDSFRTPDHLTFDLDLAVYPDCCMAFGLYELTTARVIKRLLQPGSHFVDGGANLGYFTLLAARLVGPTGRVDAFEPDPANRQRLLDHLARNHLAGPNVRIHPNALADADRLADFFSPDPQVDNHGTASLFRDPNWADNSDIHIQQVRCVRMDQTLAGTYPDLIKLDIEGGEAEAIEGMAGLLRPPAAANADWRPPALLIEYNPHKSSAAGGLADAPVHRALRLCPAYQVYTIGWRLRRIDPADLARLGQANLLLRAP